MSRSWIWLQLLIGWLPVWALFSLMIYVAHGGDLYGAMRVALRMMVLAAILGVAVHRLTGRVPWPYPFQLRFVGIHLLAAAAYASTWLLLNNLVESVIHWRWVSALGPGLGPYLITGVWLYVMVAGVAYSARAAERAAQLRSLEARSQLAALRAQLHPHFLFNALHTVVQLIPVDPRAATRAAEQLAEVLRSVIDQPRELWPLAQEWSLVERYLAIEAIRFGDRLIVQSDIAAAASAITLPSFALQTLVENAIRHGAAPRIATTTLRISAKLHDQQLHLSVSDDGEGADPQAIEAASGTGLRRLRERLALLYGSRARLELNRLAQGGFCAELIIPEQAPMPVPEPEHD